MMAQWVTGQPLGLRVYVHGRMFRRSFVWPLVLTLLVMPWTLPYAESWPAYAQQTLQYGMFLWPLVAAWVVPRLLPEGEAVGWLAAVRLPAWRLVMEQSLLALLLFALLWWTFLGLSWVIQALLVLETGTTAAPPALVGWIGLSGTVSLLFFTGCSLLGRHWRGTEVAGFLATSLWIGSLLLARQGPNLFTPFHAYYALGSPAFEAMTADLGIQLGVLGLVALGLWAAGIGLSSERVHPARNGPRRSPWPGSLAGILRGPHILRLTLLELRWVVRRKLFGLYLGVPLGLVLALAFFEGSLDLTEFLTDTTTNLLFFTLPLLAVLLAPVLTRPQRPGHDWFWVTPTAWVQGALAQLLAFGLIALGATLMWGAFALAWGVGQAYWTWSQAMPLIPAWASLWLPMSMVHVFLICGLALLLRQALAVIALACVVMVGMWLSAAVYTLTTLQDAILVSLTFSPVTGVHPDYGLARSLVWVYTAGGLLFWLVALCLYPYGERRVSLTWTAQAGTGTLVGLGLALCLVASGIYQRTGESRRVPASPVPQSNAWAVTEMSHQLVFAGDHVTVTSALAFVPTVAPVPSTLELSLNSGLRLHRVVWSEQSLAWQQPGEGVIVPLPAALQAAAASGPIALVLEYGGWPVLPREDYSPTIVAGLVGNSLINNFNRASVSYAGPHFLQWVRDSDWTVWPVTGGPHVASQANAWSMELPRQAFPYLIAPQATRQVVGDRIRLHGQGVPPAVLLLAGDYQVSAANGEAPVWLGPYQGPRDRTRVQPLREVYTRLAQWADPAASSPRVAYFPFGERLHFADSWMLVPAMPRDLRLMNDHAHLKMAIRVTEDWLYDHIAWKPAPIVSSGLRVWHALHCDMPMEGQRQPCMVAMDAYRRNPQVPHGRVLDAEYCLFPSLRLCGGISPLRRAWALALAYYVAADPAWFHDDVWAPWRSAAQTPAIPDSDHLIGATSDMHDNCLVAGYVLTIHHLVEQHGVAFLHDWLNLMRERHPVGATPVDEVVWQLAAELTGQPAVPRHPTACIGIDVIN